MNGVLASTCNRVFSETGGMSLSHRMGEGRGEGYGLAFFMQLDRNRQPTLSLSPPMGEGIHWCRAEFIGRMPRFFGALSLLTSAPTMSRIVQARVHASASSLIV